MVKSRTTYFCCSLALLLLSCNGEKSQSESDKSDTPIVKQIYQQVAPELSNITFSNNILETVNFNYFLYPFIYFGGGVAIGDINNDSLPDIYFTSNMGLNALYLNQGGLKFRDITGEAGVEGIWNRWTTGVTMVDINSDGYLDIYVNVAGPKSERGNLLYVNKGDNTFVEMAAKYGIADNGHSIQSAFFDYDRDGDLDLYVGNYPPSGFAKQNTFFAKKMKSPDPLESDKLYRNEGDYFEDVTEQAGILNFGLTLGISIADFNGDGWPDVYLSNDFNSSDYLYINQGDGTFINEISNYTMHTSNFGMGTDAADINNDGYIDLIQLDMMSSTNEQQKANMSAMNPEQFQEMIDHGLHYQYMKNTLQLNTGNGTFSEIGELAGIAYTDWSWGSLLLDMNNNGHKDIFITNGMRRNVNDNDFNAFFRIQKAYNEIAPAQYLDLLKKIPVRPVENYAYLNNGDLTFQQMEADYGLNYKGFSNGAAYADLDLDGDLDLVVNNLDAKSHIAENISNPDNNANFLRFSLKGEKDNQLGIGTRISIYINGNKQCQELYLTRGYQSSVEPIVHFGLGNATTVDSVKIIWPNGDYQILYKVAANQFLVARLSEADKPETVKNKDPTLFTTFEPNLSPDFSHTQNKFNDFEREVLLPHKMSQFGPALAVGDVNLDGLDDFYVGGASGFSGSLYLQQKDGSFKAYLTDLWEKDKQHEDVSAIFFDANGDRFPDLYIVSGGNEKPQGDAVYKDRFYLNDGRGGFSKLNSAIPELPVSGACVRVADFDRDGDMDLFIGGRQLPGKYPLPASGYLLRNDSDLQNVHFSNETEEIAPELTDVGMITDALWDDFNKDGWLDLIITGEWMSVTILQNNQGTFKNASAEYGLDNQVGWWSSIASGDLDNDGDLDFVAGNLGLNHKYKASITEPFKIFAGDLDNSGSLDIVLGYYNEGELYPLRGRECSSQQIPSIKKKFPNYSAFSKASLVDVYSLDKLNATLRYEAVTFANTVFINDSGKFTPHILPNYMQISSVNAIHIDDMDNDGIPDIFLGGNLYHSEVETPRNDASFGLFGKGDGTGKFFKSVAGMNGIDIKGEIRAIASIKMADGVRHMLVGRNNDKLMLIR